MATLLQDFRYGLRTLGKNPGFTVVAVLTLALGIGANTSIFTIINAVLLNPLPVKNVSSLVQLDTTDRKTMVTAANFTRLGMSFPNYQDVARANDVFSGVAAFQATALTLSGRGPEPKRFQGALVTANYFDVLGVPAVVGRTFLPQEDQRPGGDTVCVLSYALWVSEFGGERSVIGRQITLNDTSYTVVGVTPPGFKGTFLFASANQIWVPVSMHSQVVSGFIEDNFNDRRFLDFLSFARLKPGVTIGRAQAEIETIAASLEKEFPKDNAGRSEALSPLADATLGINQHGQIVLVGGVLMAVVGLVLLIGCVNLANLLLAQAAKREKEMSLRAALGATGVRLLRQMLTESVTLALLGGAAGLAIAYWGRSLLWSMRPAALAQSDLNLALDGRVLAFTFALAIVTGLLFGVVPALKASRPNLIEALNAGGRSGSLVWGRSRLRQCLVISEVALALIALAGAGLFLRSLDFAERVDPGFESKNLFTFQFNLGSQHYDQEHGEQFFQDAVERAAAVAGVQQAAVGSNPPLGGGLARTVFVEGQDEKSGQRGTLTTVDAVSPGYFETIRVPLLRGRAFSDSDRQHTAPVAVVNRAMANHFWPGADPVGKRFHFFGDPTLREVVGEVADTVQLQIGEDPQPVVYQPLTQSYTPAATLFVRTANDPRPVISAVRAQVQSLDRNLALTNVTTIGGVLDQGLWAPRMGATLLGAFAGLALLLAAIGIYGVLSYSVSQRAQEMGIRMALGATSRQVVRLVVTQGLRLALVGVAVGVPLALLFARMLASLLFGVKPADPATFVAVPLILVGVAFLACYIPGRRATKVDPIAVLRYQ